MTEHAAAAKFIRIDLKQAFPNTKFQVTSESFSMGNSVDVHWTDGPTTEQVKNIICHYQFGHFDGMTDSYEYSNRRKDIPQTKFLSCNRHMSQQAEAQFSADPQEAYRAFAHHSYV